MTATLMLDTLEKVKEFVGIVRTRPYEVDLTSGRYVINGKSIIGIFGLDLTCPVTLKTTVDDPSLLEEIEKFIVKV